MEQYSYVCEGIRLEFSNNILIAKNNVTNTGPYAIFLNFSDRNYVLENLLMKNEIALQLAYAGSNIILANNVTQNKLGILISCAGNNTLRNNVISNNWPFGNFGVYGKTLSDFLNVIDASNSVDGKPIYYLLNQHNVNFCLSDAGYLALVNSSNVILENLNLSGNYQAITLALSSNVTLRNLQITNNFQGIYMFGTNSSTIMGTHLKETTTTFTFIIPILILFFTTISLTEKYLILSVRGTFGTWAIQLEETIGNGFKFKTILRFLSKYNGFGWHMRFFPLPIW